MVEFEENSASENGINPDLYERKYHIEELAEWAFLKAHRAYRDNDVDLMNDADHFLRSTQEYLEKIYCYDNGSFELTGETSLSDEEAYAYVLMERSKAAREREDHESFSRADELVSDVEEIISEDAQDEISLQCDSWCFV